MIEECEFKNNKFWNGIRYERLNAKWIKNTIENGKSISSEPCAEPELNEEASSMYELVKELKIRLKECNKIAVYIEQYYKDKNGIEAKMIFKDIVQHIGIIIIQIIRSNKEICKSHVKLFNEIFGFKYKIEEFSSIYK